MSDDRKPLPQRMYESGFTDLIPIIPPGASLAPTSKIPITSIGKIPGKRLDNGLWVGFDWRKLKATIDDVRTWATWGANVGLRSDNWPGVDIDCADPALAQIIEDAALAQLGTAPVRIGNPPKRLLPYVLVGEPFGRMRLVLKKGEKSYLVEILAQGQQYLVHGTHPTTMKSYSWSEDPTEALMSPMSREMAENFLGYLTDTLTMLGYECKRIGDGTERTADRGADQQTLEAPSIDDLRQAMELIPNDDLFPGYPEYIKMLHAVRAAAGPNDEDGYEIMAAWAQKRNNGEGPSVPGESVRSLWRRTVGPFAVGWSWIAELARPHGFNDAPFAPVAEPEEVDTESVAAPYLSDQYLAVKVVEAQAGVLRYVPANGIALVWNKGRWQSDAELLAEDTVKLELRRIANRIDGQGGSAGEQKANEKKALEICSGGKVGSVWGLVKSDRAIAVAPESLDFDPWILNTPGGIVDLRTGKMGPPDPDQLCTRSTSITPDFGAVATRWLSFLDEATQGDKDTQAYLKRLAGYALTGSTREQQYTFIYGDGGNGKGKFLEVMMNVLGSYHRDSPMETFIATSNERHPTELAGLAGARLVTASETNAGRRWDEAKLKRMTGGDPITARAMREDFFTYMPQFKLVFIGNAKPDFNDVGHAMRRRTHLVPFDFKPPVDDKRLSEKLRAEYSAILAWMIEGCLEWQEIGLQPPTAVLAATEEYFSDTDTVGQWLEENTEAAPGEWVELQDLFRSWLEWCNRRGGEYHGKVQRLGQILVAKQYATRKHPRTRRKEIGGLKIANRRDPLEGIA